MWSAFLHPTRQPAWESAAASVYLRLFEERAPFERQQMYVKLWTRLAGGLVGLVSGSSGAPAHACALAVLKAPGAFQALADRPSPALALLAIRAARRALADNPSDAFAALALGHAYITLGAVSGDAEQGGTHAPLPLLRHVQTVAVLNRALILQPELEAAHAALAELYGRREYFDAALTHLQSQVRLAQSGPRPGEDHRAFATRLAGLERSAEELEKLVQDRRHQYTVQGGLPGAGTDPLSRALLALRLGLPGKALETLERSQVEVFGSAGARLQLELLLMLGRAGEARDKLLDEQMQANGYKLGRFQLPVIDSARRGHAYSLPAYEWLCLCESAANGDYDRAEELLAAMGERLRVEETRMNLPRLRAALAETVLTEVGLGSSPTVLSRTVKWLRVGLCAMYAPAAQLPDERADLKTVAGLLALERGLPEAQKLSRNFVALPVAEVYAGRLNARTHADRLIGFALPARSVIIAWGGGRASRPRGQPSFPPLACCRGKSMAQPGKHFSESSGTPTSSAGSARVPDQHQLDFEIAFFSGILDYSPDYVDVLRILGSLLTLKGRFAEGLKLDRRLVRLRPDDALAHYNLACSFALLKRPEQSLATLRRAVELGYRDFRFMREDRDLEIIRDDPRFRQLLREYEIS
jgi:tetratricopeptide (TPR) repeat protein